MKVIAICNDSPQGSPEIDLWSNEDMQSVVLTLEESPSVRVVLPKPDGLGMKVCGTNKVYDLKEAVNKAFLAIYKVIPQYSI